MKSLQELAAIRDRMKQTVSTREAAHDSVRVVGEHLVGGTPVTEYTIGAAR